MSKFNPGDRVRYTEKCEAISYVGKYGTVTGYNERHDTYNIKLYVPDFKSTEEVLEWLSME